MMPPKHNKGIRSYNAGQKMASAILEMVHLMYQNKTALNFYDGLLTMLMVERERREAEYEKTPTRDLGKFWPWR